MGSINDFRKDSVSMTRLKDNPFTITHIEPGTYNSDSGPKPSVTITTKEEFNVDEKMTNKFHTTRQAVVSTLTKDIVLKAVNEDEDPIGPVKCVKKKSTKSSNDYYALEDVKKE